MYIYTIYVYIYIYIYCWVIARIRTCGRLITSLLSGLCEFAQMIVMHSLTFYIVGRKYILSDI